jgi:hypothetical protein
MIVLIGVAIVLILLLIWKLLNRGSGNRPF